MKNCCEAGATVHGIRNAFRDRLRDINAPVDLIDQLGGWASSHIGLQYGDGYSVKRASSWLSEITHRVSEKSVSGEMDLP